MAKLTLPEIVSGYLGAGKINEALLAIASAFENTVSRNGATPNTMLADLDLNGHSLLNLGSSSTPNSLVTVESMQDYVDSRASSLLVQRVQSFVASAAQTVFNLTSFTYQPNTGNIAVYVNGLRKFAGSDYTETDQDTITFLTGLSASDKVAVVQTEYLATVAFPSHTHPWAQITDRPVYTTRWPSWGEITEKPAIFTPAAHTHPTSDITSGRLADARRGVFVQSGEPTGLGSGDAGALWFW